MCVFGFTLVSRIGARGSGTLGFRVYGLGFRFRGVGFRSLVSRLGGQRIGFRLRDEDLG